MAILTHELGIDLGTNNTLVIEGNQVLIDEPTITAILVEEQKMVEWGQAAKDMEGRVPESIEIVRPMNHGVIAEYEITEKLLGIMVKRVSGTMRFFRPRIMLTVPYGASSVESRAVHEAGLGAGSREVFLIHQPLAAALGVDLPIASPSGSMILSIGGGTIQAAVLAMNNIIRAGTSRTGGAMFDEAIVVYVRKKYGIVISEQTAEQLKIRIGSAIPTDQQQIMEIQGQDQVTGLPKALSLTTDDIFEAIHDPLAEIVNTCKGVLEKTPPELISDIIDRGVAICGGGSLLNGLDKYLTKSLGLPAYLVDNPTTCTAEGAYRAMGMRETMKRSLLAT